MSIQAVFFDAVGTLIHPEPSAAVAYHSIAARFGSALPLATVRSNFARAFARQEQLDAQNGFRTSEARELQRWRDIVAEVLPDLDPRWHPACFQALYDHFVAPTAWRCDPAAADVIAELRQRGLQVGMASNFDHRLRGVVAGLPALAQLQHLVISSEVGWKKPAAEFFSALCAMVALPAANVLLVGDDEENDLLGASRAGLPSVLLAATGEPGGDRIRELRQMLDRVR